MLRSIFRRSPKMHLFNYITVTKSLCTPVLFFINNQIIQHGLRNPPRHRDTKLTGQQVWYYSDIKETLGGIQAKTTVWG